MGNLLTTGRRKLVAWRAAHCARTIGYHRGESTAYVAATIAATSWEAVDSSGRVTRSDSRDFIVPSASLLPILGASPPAVGDVIYEPAGSETYIYEVAAPAGIPVFELIDDRAAYRIHTRGVGREPRASSTTVYDPGELPPEADPPAGSEE